MKTGIAEYLINISNGKTKTERKQLLKDAVNNTPQVMTILKYMFKDSIEFNLPPGSPPFKTAEKREDLQGALYSELRKLRNFMKGEHPNMTQVRREQLFIQLLESVDPDDANLLIAMKDKVSPYKNLTKKFVMETLPSQTIGW